ncbi:MAG: hypothetical protein PHW03_02505 [Eubacteriales bacterium]|nr:hypothetical protein [Eubacteriales bacterium]MDD4389654.1 hypothetical protein [Eubacteriales bacterium]
MKKEHFYASVPKKKKKFSDDLTPAPKHMTGKKAGKLAIIGLIAGVGAFLLARVPKKY